MNRGGTTIVRDNPVHDFIKHAREAIDEATREFCIDCARAAGATGEIDTRPRSAGMSGFVNPDTGYIGVAQRIGANSRVYYVWHFMAGKKVIRDKIYYDSARTAAIMRERAALAAEIKHSRLNFPMGMPKDTK